MYASFHLIVFLMMLLFVISRWWKWWLTNFISTKKRLHTRKKTTRWNVEFEDFTNSSIRLFPLLFVRVWCIKNWAFLDFNTLFWRSYLPSKWQNDAVIKFCFDWKEKNVMQLYIPLSFFFCWHHERRNKLLRILCFLRDVNIYIYIYS